jgi:hypothetical protein
MRFELVVVVVVLVLFCKNAVFYVPSKASRFMWANILLSVHLRPVTFLYNKLDPVKT